MRIKKTTRINGKMFYLCPECGSDNLGAMQTDEQPGPWYKFGCKDCGTAPKGSANVTHALSFRGHWNYYAKNQAIRNRTKRLLNDAKQCKNEVTNT